MTTDKNIQRTQQEVDEVIEAVKKTVELMIDSHDKTSNVVQSTENLMEKAKMLQEHSATIGSSRKYWWQDSKMIMAIIAIVAVLLILVGISYFY